MLLYKYRSLIHFNKTLDIIQNEQLYCSEWSKLNDPMEGVFTYPLYADDMNELEVRKALSNIREEKKKLRVCSLSGVSDSMNAYLMWSHYGNEFRGVAFGYDFSNLPHIKAEEINYTKGFASLPKISPSSCDGHATDILLSKMACWNYENEYRILHTEKFLDVKEGLKKVIIGHRADPNYIEAIKTICSEKNINVYITGCGEAGVSFDKLPDWDYATRSKKGH